MKRDAACSHLERGVLVGDHLAGLVHCRRELSDGPAKEKGLDN